MQWLAQNWLWILLVVGFFFMMRRGGCGGGMKSHGQHGGDTQHGNEENKSRNYEREGLQITEAKDIYK